MGLRVVAAAVLATAPILSFSPQSGQAPIDQPGQRITPWRRGLLDIHQISTGSGNAGFVVMPDGTTLLIDAGDANDPGSDSQPSGKRSAAIRIADYINDVLPPSSPRRLDYALITHFHGDHMGAAGPGSPPSSHGTYVLSGITEVASLIPVRKIIDRGWPEYGYPVPLTSPLVTNYRRFLERGVADHSLSVEQIRVGQADQLIQVRDPAASPAFEIRNVAGNGKVWTGVGNGVIDHFPSNPSLDPDLPWENLSSIGLRIRYGRFDFFTGGDMYGIPDPGTPSWIDLESDVARAIGPTDVHVVNMHGSISVENERFLAILRSRVVIVPSWSPTHPSADVLKRVMAPSAYPGPRDVFATVLHQSTRVAVGPRAEQIKGIGHIVVRVDPSGATYRVIVVNPSTDALSVVSVHGPYDAN